MTPRANAEMPMAERRLLEPIVTPEAIEQVMADLLHELPGVLQERGLGGRSDATGAYATKVISPPPV